ncbi:hypothetical protein [uncultured Maribacter sp.]|uniref:hypothetical protein n=1 Tax=uncultured Maribacter sp. TaxID=431308 RepID=UPI0030ECB94D|tara:strand:- start:121815 stop:122036 length:222 start_codon:yes stop_codon:yes gene_type:complete
MKSIQLLIDVMSDAYITLDVIVNVLKQYLMIIENDSISIIISGFKGAHVNRGFLNRYPTIIFTISMPLPMQII